MCIAFGVSGAGRILYAAVAVLLLASSARADCLGEYRETTAAEKAAWDRVSQVFPRLVRVPAEYVLKKSEITVSHDGRCTDGENDPIYLPVHLRYELQDEALQQLRREIQRVDAAIMAVWRKYQPQFSSLQSEFGQHAASYPPSPQDQKAMEQIEKRMNELERQQEEESAALKTERKRLSARLSIEMDGYFNSEAADCKGNAVTVQGSAAACLQRFEDGGTHLMALLGTWRKGEDGWTAVFDSRKLSHALQTLEISVSAADGMDIAEMLNWQAAAVLLNE